MDNHEGANTHPTPPHQPILLPHPNSQNITSALATDSSGLCLGHIGDPSLSPDRSGSYASILKLASRLDHGAGGTGPTVVVEGGGSAILMKEYHGRCVVFRVPVVEKKGEVLVTQG